MATELPRVVIAGLSGDSGKTIVSLCLAAEFKRRGLGIAVFKKGPDYIDAAWLTYFSGSHCRNLDTFLVPPEDVYHSFCAHAQKSDISLIEGNRGIFDGKDVSGTHSTAGLAVLLQAPVILVVDITKSTRTVAALVKGIIDFEPTLRLAGVILNNAGGNRHKKIVTESIERYCGIPVLGTIPKLGKDSALIPGRHLGLVTPAEYVKAKGQLEVFEKIASEYIDTEKIMEISHKAAHLEYNEQPIYNTEHDNKVKIGFFSDSIFTFYYPENIEALQAEGAEMVPISSVDDGHLPDIDALYIGGGFPETQAEKLAANKSLMESVRKAAVSGMPIYAECGGLIYLSRSLLYNDRSFSMAGIFPVDLIMHEKPVGHGYVSLVVDKLNPFYATGTEIKGHEFHYTGVSENQDEAGFDQLENCLKVRSGTGLGKGRDGLLYNNTFASYAHIHALGTNIWAAGMVKSAGLYRANRSKTGTNHLSIICADDYYKNDNLLMAIGQ